MQTHQATSTLDGLNKYTVAIQEAVESNAEVLGTGVVVTADRVILICYNVVGDNECESISHKTVNVYFPVSKITITAKVIEKYCNSIKNHDVKLGRDDIVKFNRTVQSTGGALPEVRYVAEKILMFIEGFAKAFGY